MSYNVSPIRWDAHGCPPFMLGTDLSFLKRYKHSGVDFISLNVGFDLTSQAEVLETIDYFHRWISMNSDEFEVVGNVGHINECKRSNKLAIAFDVEGCNVLNGDIEMVSRLYRLGVRQLAFVYNRSNSYGGGCLDDDRGLTKSGKELVELCNDIGMMIDCSHVGDKTSKEIIELSKHPVVFSHSNPAGLFPHRRNISDDQMTACAEKGGVIGINGIGIFLGDNDVRSERIVDHIDYAVNVAGIDHVGIGLDCVFAEDEIKTYAAQFVETFPVEHDFVNVRVSVPEQFPEIEKLLISRGYCQDDVNKVLGENFLRASQSVWK